MITVDLDRVNIFWAVLASAILAAGVRAALFHFDAGLDYPHVWLFQARAALIAAQHLAGMPVDLESIRPGVMTTEEALTFFRYGERGTTIIHLIIIRLLGETGYLHLQSLHILMDSTAAGAVAGTAAYLGGRLASWVAGMAYAFFIPQRNQRQARDPRGNSDVVWAVER